MSIHASLLYVSKHTHCWTSWIGIHVGRGPRNRPLTSVSPLSINDKEGRTSEANPNESRMLVPELPSNFSRNAFPRVRRICRFLSPVTVLFPELELGNPRGRLQCVSRFTMFPELQV